MNDTLIRSIPLFAGVGRRRQRKLAALVDEVTVPAGTTLTAEGAYAKEFFVIVEGSARVTRRDRSPAPALELLATLGPGDFFGEGGLLGAPSRSATVVATSPMRLLVTGPREFSTLMHTYPGVAGRIRAAFAARQPVTA
jgi:CRP/FNR family transcriptional regulator, cyclic AMP receptor protein